MSINEGIYLQNFELFLFLSLDMVCSANALPCPAAMVTDKLIRQLSQNKAVADRFDKTNYFVIESRGLFNVEALRVMPLCYTTFRQ